MREILFKAKRIDNGEWAEGFLTKMWGQYHIISLGDENTAYPIDEETICQYTGSIDRKNNKIWENDILYVNSRQFIIHYYKPFAMYMLKGINHGGGANGMTIQLKESEVIGNIFDYDDTLADLLN